MREKRIKIQCAQRQIAKSLNFWYRVLNNPPPHSIMLSLILNLYHIQISAYLRLARSAPQE